MADSIHEQRLRLGADAMFSVDRAARMLPWNNADAVLWLRRRGVVLLVDGHEVVIWGDACKAARNDASQPNLRAKPGAKSSSHLKKLVGF